MIWKLNVCLVAALLGVATASEDGKARPWSNQSTTPVSLCPVSTVTIHESAAGKNGGHEIYHNTHTVTETVNFTLPAVTLVRSKIAWNT